MTQAASLTADLIIRATKPAAVNNINPVTDTSIQIAFENPTPSPARTLQQSLADTYGSCASTPCRRERDELGQDRDYWKRLATTDELTNLQNRRGLNLALDEEQENLDNGTSQGGVVLFVDMDGFKSINDRFGHEWGDRCLRIAGSVLGGIQTLIRDTDIVATANQDTSTAARFGGDEFVVILRDTTMEKSQDRITAITQKLNSMSVYATNRQPVHEDAPEETYMARIRASVGTFEYKPGDRLVDVLKQADENMYAAKQARKAVANTPAQVITPI